MKNLLVKCIETFLIYIFLIFKVLNDVIIVNFYPWSPFHIKIFNILHDFFDQSHVRDIHRLIKRTVNNYKIYGLIIVKIAKKSLVLDYGLSNVTFETLNHAFALIKVYNFIFQNKPLNQKWEL